MQSTAERQAEAWEGWVGSQTPEEFMSISREKGYTTVEEAVAAYVQDLLDGHISSDVRWKWESQATDEEREQIRRHGINSGVQLIPDDLADLLAGYIRRNLKEVTS